MVADPVERLDTQVQRGERLVGTPQRVVVATVDVGGQRVLAGVTTRAVTAVVTEGDRFGQRDVEPQRPCHGGGDLRHLEGVGEAGALVVVGEDEHLRLAAQPAERGRVQDAVSVTLEAGAPRIGLLLDRSVAPGHGPGGEWRKVLVVGRLACRPSEDTRSARAGPRIAMGEDDGAIVGAGAGHRGRPAGRSVFHRGHEGRVPRGCVRVHVGSAGVWGDSPRDEIRDSDVRRLGAVG